MAQQNERKWRALREQVIREGDPNEMLDILLALDRMVVELSLRVYKIPRGDRFLMREHNRRLHEAVRENLPRLLELSRS